MNRLAAIFALLSLLLFAAAPAHGVMLRTEKTAVPDFFWPPHLASGDEPPCSQDCTRDAAIDGYDFASDVRVGPNLYAYVQQNPWSKFDAHGLSGWELRPPQAWSDAGVRNLHDSAEYKKGFDSVAWMAPAAFLAIPLAPVLLEMGAVGVAKEVADEAFDTGFEAVTGFPAPPTSFTDVGQKLLKEGREKIAKDVGEQTAQNIAKQSEELIEKVDPRNLISRQGPSEMTGSKVKRLTKDMEKNGFDPSHPIEVAEVDGKKIIIDGHHRAEAAKKAKIPEVPVKKTEVTPEKAEKLSQEAADAASERASRSR